MNGVARSSIDDLPILINELETAIERNDQDALELAAYTIRGVASNFHAKPLMRLADMLEKHHGILSAQELERLFVNIESESRQLIAFLRRKVTSIPR